ncbi:MAG: SAM-dependent methyltransferase, partial [Caldimonas sp.]
MSESLPSSYFDSVYAASKDPWSFETSAYEAAKYADTVAALGERRFARGFEIGCSIGVLTRLLAARCERLLAVDVNESALEAARSRCADLPHVELRRMAVPAEFAAGPLDLVVMSEVGYYWSPPDLERALLLAEAAL